MTSSFESFRPRDLNEQEKEIFISLQEIEGVEVSPSFREINSFQLRFKDETSIITVGVTFFDEESGADIAITSIVHLSQKGSEDEINIRRQGKGSQIVQKILTWAKEHNYQHVIATQVQPTAKNFWAKNGFVYDERENNVSEDWVYKEA